MYPPPFFIAHKKFCEFNEKQSKAPVPSSTFYCSQEKRSVSFYLRIRNPIEFVDMVQRGVREVVTEGRPSNNQSINVNVNSVKQWNIDNNNKTDKDER
jgi:hypothetical protein